MSTMHLLAQQLMKRFLCKLYEGAMLLYELVLPRTNEDMACLYRCNFEVWW